MINLKDIDIEYISSAIFGLTGLILSLFIGFISGNAISLVIIRALIITIIFSILGFACILIIKKYVPEIYKIFTSINNNEEVEIKPENLEEDIKDKKPIIDSSVSEEINLHEDKRDEELENEFNTFDNQSEEDSYASKRVVDSKNIFNEKKIKYEPKIAAQAIRTMLKRDE